MEKTIPQGYKAEMIQIESSTVIEYGYDPTKKVLIVNYKKSGFYVYQNIPEEDFKDIKNAPSVGKGIRHVVASRIYSRISEDKDFVRIKK